jgi:hypothetical protein
MTEKKDSVLLLMTPPKQIMMKKNTVWSISEAPDTPADTVTSSFSGNHGTLDQDDFGIDPDDFGDAIGDVGKHWTGYIWSSVMGVMGALDVLATFAPHLQHLGGCLLEEENFCHRPRSLCSTWITFTNWLIQRNVGISFIFSLLWFKLAFNKARNAKERAMVEHDRQVLLSCSEEKDKKKLDPQSVYCLEILTHMLFLPVGFYVIIYHFLHGLLIERKSLWEEIETSSENETIVFSVTEETYGDEGGHTSYEIFTEKSKISLIMAILRHIHLCYLAGTVIVRSKINRFVRRNAIPQLGRKLLGSAFRNPRKFRRKVAASLRLVRYVRYLLPIIGGLNKLKANVEDGLKKWKQSRIAQKRRHIRMILWQGKPQRVKEQEAAIMIQSAWRAHNARRHTYALMLITKDKKVIAARRIQATLRRKLVKARHHILIKEQELRRLELECMRKSFQMKEHDRRRLYQLQDEFTEEARKTINRRLLLRPNTRFAVAWKAMFVVCIGVEISQKALAPLIKNRFSKIVKKDTHGMTIRELMAEQLIPRSTSEREGCKDLGKLTWLEKLHLNKTSQQRQKRTEQAPTNSSWYCFEPYSEWNDASRDVISLLLEPYPVTEWSTCQGDKPKTVLGHLSQPFRGKSKPRRWYCSEPYASLQAAYRWLADFLIDEFLVLVSMICFLDVFVTFFMGELDPDTGELVAKPFFNRWIAPGLLLQLLANPAIESFSRFLFGVWQEIQVLGPLRVMRWCIAVFVPIVYAISKCVLKGIQEAELDKSLVDFYNMDPRMSFFIK